MASGWLQARQTRYTAYVTLYILIVIGVLGLGNWLANRHNKSVDTTAALQSIVAAAKSAGRETVLLRIQRRGRPLTYVPIRVR